MAVKFRFIEFNELVRRVNAVNESGYLPFLPKDDKWAKTEIDKFFKNNQSIPRGDKRAREVLTTALLVAERTVHRYERDVSREGAKTRSHVRKTGKTAKAKLKKVYYCPCVRKSDGTPIEEGKVEHSTKRDHDQAMRNKARGVKR